MGGSKSEFGNSEEEELTFWLDCDGLGQSRVRVKELARVRFCRMMSISATRNAREDFPDSVGLSVEVGMFAEKLTTLTRACKIYGGTGW